MHWPFFGQCCDLIETWDFLLETKRDSPRNLIKISDNLRKGKKKVKRRPRPTSKAIKRKCWAFHLKWTHVATRKFNLIHFGFLWKSHFQANFVSKLCTIVPKSFLKLQFKFSMSLKHNKIKYLSFHLKWTQVAKRKVNLLHLRFHNSFEKSQFQDNSVSRH